MNLEVHRSLNKPHVEILRLVLVHYLTTLKTGKKFKWASFFIELICSAFVGVVIGFFFISTHMPIYMALAGAGVAGHLGTRSLMMLRDKYGFKDYER